jgi:hypothetical protein
MKWGRLVFEQNNPLHGTFFRVSYTDRPWPIHKVKIVVKAVSMGRYRLHVRSVHTIIKNTFPEIIDSLKNHLGNNAQDLDDAWSNVP